MFHWEYWPFQIIYIPIYFLWIFYAIKARTLFFFNACNPRIRNGGFIAESKKEIYDLIPQKFYPKTELINEKIPLDEVFSILNRLDIQFPFIAKPDIGLRGSAVQKIHNLSELETYHNKANFDYLIQDLIPFNNEVGIFYVRFPNQEKGKITGIVGKEFLEVTGDGNLSIAELLHLDPRFEMQLKVLQKEYGDHLNHILNLGEKRNLVPYGNHARGAKFIDLSHLISVKLNEMMDKMCQQIPEFYFGRLDVMYKTWEGLENGENFSIVELNGAGSEPTHIYDPKHSLFFAWYELARHITYMYRISVQNHKNGLPYLTFKEGAEQWRIQKQQQNKIYNF